ncbi:MAG: flagellin N-terminal helical domain-containing protein, partial [Planctomycetota bacterium]
MPNIIGIPTTRLSNMLVHERVLEQVQYNQMEYFRLEQQLSTGRAFEVPGEKPVTALRVMSLQGLLERKEQIRTNLATNQSFLTATDVAFSRVSNLVAETRATALGVVDDIASEHERKAALLEITEAVRHLVSTGNRQFRDRFLFAGSATAVAPFEQGPGSAVLYLGNEEQLQSYSDLDSLFATNVLGSEAFGAISEPVRGSVDLNPVLTFDTRLADLRGGQGVTRGSIAVSDGTATSIVDLTSAETIGDVAALIQAQPPQSTTLDVEVTATGLKIRLASGAGNLSIREVNDGTTAFELGILAEAGVGNNWIQSDDLDPILRPTTRLDGLLGTRATAVVRSPGRDNDFIVEAATNGTALDGVEIRFVDDTGAGGEWAEYLAGAVPPRIDVHVNAGQTITRDVVRAINDAHALDPAAFPFTARVDPLDDRAGGEGRLLATATGQTEGGSGIDLDRNSGLQIVQGDETYTIDLASAETVEDLLNLLNGAGAGLLAEINELGTGIDVRSRLSGVDFAIGENGGTTATQLGLRTFTTATRLDSLDFGRG